MDSQALIDGLIWWVGLVILVTFHEFGHAWMAWKCGDDTAKNEGRVTLNPIDHIDLFGTVIIPLAMVLLSSGGSGAGRFLIGWAKPVPVNHSNLRNPRLDDVLVTLAGPVMNVILAILLVGLARIGVLANAESMVEVCLDMAHFSLFLCFFNLLPIPPLDGSQIVRVITGMSYDTFARIAQWGFVILIIAIQIPYVTWTLALASGLSFGLLTLLFGIPI
jgi:Zn-dependent protease